MEKFIIGIFLLLVFVYYVTLALHLFGLIKLTENKKILNSNKIFIPFYLWKKR